MEETTHTLSARHHGYAFLPSLEALLSREELRALADDANPLEVLARPPKKTLDDEHSARPGYRDEKVYAKKHEFQDEPAVLRAKVKVLLSWIRALAEKKATVVYSGAGISTSSGIADYASSDRKEVAAPAGPLGQGGRGGSGSGNGSSGGLGNSPYLAQPTPCHRVLASMYNTKPTPFIHSWIQQNHDGLPQKAGVPQVRLNEIHGSIYDPSNPVVPMSGALRTDLFEDLMHWESHAELVLALGTSLSGMNADRVCTSCSKRHRKAFTAQKSSADAGGSYTPGGLVVCSLQATAIESSPTHDYDASRVCALRFWCELDTFARVLAEELGVPLNSSSNDNVVGDEGGNGDTFIFRDLPYDPVTGLKSDTTVTTLDLSDDSEVVITDGPHRGDVGECVGVNMEGHFNIRFLHRLPGKALKAPMERKLGRWWIDGARKGELRKLPVVNQTPAVTEHYRR